MSGERPVREDFDSWGAHHDALVAWTAADAVNGRRCLRCGTVGGRAGGCPLSLDGDHHYPDLAPSPSIADPSDERWRDQIRDLTVDDLIRTASNIGETEACRPLLDWNQEGSWGHPPVDAVLAFMHTAWTAQRVARTLAAARPTSLPEAPEPDEDGGNRCAWCGVPHRDGWWTAYGDDDAHWFMRQGEQLRWRETSGSSAATPSAPPVAVDPGPESFAAISPTGWVSDPDDDGVQIGPTPWCATVERWAGDPYPKGAPTHWTWELVNPDGTVELSGCETDDPAAFLSRIVDLLTPAVDPEAGAGAS